MSQASLTELLHLTVPPVAITFVDAAPPGVPHVAAVEPAGCGYWRRAAGGEVFFTLADDHKGCPVGAHTHNVTLSPAEHQELMGLVQTMVGTRGDQLGAHRRQFRLHRQPGLHRRRRD